MKKLLLVLSLLSAQGCLAQELVFEDVLSDVDWQNLKPQERGMMQGIMQLVTYYNKSGQIAYMHKYYADLLQYDQFKVIAVLERFAIEYIKNNPQALDADQFEDSQNFKALSALDFVDPITKKIMTKTVSVESLMREAVDHYSQEAQAKNIPVDAQAIKAIAALDTSINIMVTMGGEGTFLKRVIDYGLQQISK